MQGGRTVRGDRIGVGTSFEEDPDRFPIGVLRGVGQIRFGISSIIPLWSNRAAQVCCRGYRWCQLGSSAPGPQEGRSKGQSD